ncbi:GNAT family N-acetyltransferase [Microbacterium sp. LTA6]|uniref:GNAT family N-acetyltransferase n=1 Tax=unclassified Microbacterium TaxID=2609290 RepID=UPI003138A12C
MSARRLSAAACGGVWPARTPRLEIRPCTAEDIDTMWGWRRLPEVSQWLSAAPDTLGAFRAYFRAPDRLASTFIIDLHAEREDEPRTPIGDVTVRCIDGGADEEVAGDARGVEAELGWALDPAHEGNGYATEAVRAVIDTCFGSLGMRRVHAGCFADDERSWRLMEHLGMRREGVSRKSTLHHSGTWLDWMSYGLLAEEWPVIELVRGSIPADVERCVSLWTEVASAREGSAEMRGTDDRLRELFDGPVARFTAAGEPLAGFVLVVPKAGDDGTLVLERLAVRPTAAGRGIDRALLTDVISWSESNEFEAIELAVGAGDGTTPLYEAAGFRPVVGPIPRALSDDALATFRLPLPASARKHGD